MRRWVGLAAGVLVTAASWGASAIPVPSPMDGGIDGGPLVAQAPPTPPRAQPPQVPPEEPTAPTAVHVLTASDRATIQKLHDMNQLQIRMGRLAQERGGSRAVKAVGRKLVAEHTAAEQKLDEYLHKRGSSLADLATTTSADADHELLATRSGAEFDRAFALQIVADHTRTIDMLQSARIATYDDVLRDLYDAMVDTEEAHKRAAQDLMPSLAHS